MNKEQYNTLISEIEKYIGELAEHYAFDVKPEVLNKLSIEQYNALIAYSKAADSKMNKWLNGELYHLIGMGDLSKNQTLKVCNLTKKMLQYRSKMKFFASIATIELSTLNTQPEYRTKAFTEIKLTTEI